MTAHIRTVAFICIDARPVDVQVQVAGGMPAFNIVGLPDKAVAESKERVRGHERHRAVPAAQADHG
jgi:magnesium chelatase family protein